MIKKIGFLFSLFAFLFYRSIQADDRILKFSEDFGAGEINSLEKWDNLDPYDYFSLETGRLKVESSLAKITGGIIPKENCWDIEGSNFDLEFDYHIAVGNPSLTLFLNFQDIDNYYLLKLEGKHKYLRKSSNGHFVFISATNHDHELFQVGENYKIKIRFYLGEIFIFIDDEFIWRVSDFSFNPDDYGRPMLTGFNSSGNQNPSVVYFDNFKYYSVPTNTILSVPYFGQGLSWWNIEEYDHGLTWNSSNAKFPAMARWGCAVTSMAMVFNHHGLDYLPDRTTPLDPGTLNNWLKSQNDGYVGEGLVNWMALTRLSRLIHEAFYQEGGENLPKLETWATRKNPKEVAFNELHDERPVILMISGHFMVGKGFSHDDIDMFINDPAFSTKKTFKEYDVYQRRPLVSTRAFIPSLTDLSYFLIVTSEQIDLVLKNDKGEVLESVVIDEKIDNHYGIIDDNNDSIQSRQLYFAKPETGEYFVDIKNQEEANAKIDVYLYDNEAEFIDFSFDSNQDLELKIEYKKDAVDDSQVTIIDNFAELENLINQLREDDDIKKKYVYILLKKLANLAQSVDNEGKERYWNLIKKFVNKFDQQISEIGKEKINLKLEAIGNKYKIN
jgi:hypothetical protein